MALIDTARGIAKRTGYQQAAVLEILKALTAEIEHNLQTKGFYAHGGLGTFKVIKKPGRTVKTLFGKPVKGKKAIVPERNGVRFRLSVALKKVVQTAKV